MEQQMEISDQRPFGLPWLDSSYQETLLPEAPWHQVRKILCDSLAKKIEKHLQNETRRQMIFEMVGPHFSHKYFPNYDNDPQLLEPPLLSADDRQKVLVDTASWIQVAIHQTVTDVQCQRPEVTQDKDEDVIAEMEDFLHHTKAIISKNMERHLYLQEEVLVKKKKTKLEAMEHIREDQQMWDKWQKAEHKRQETTHIKGILKNPQPGPVPSTASTDSRLDGDPYRPPPTPQIKADLYIPDSQPPLWGYQAESLGRSLVAILKRDPKRFGEIAWRLHGRQLPSALRTYVWLDVLLMTNREDHKGTEVNVEKVVRARFGKMVVRGMDEMLITRATHSPISSLIDKAVIEVYDHTPGMRAYQADNDHMRDATKALNVLHCFDRSYEPYLVYWLFPLQLAFREQSGEREHAYEMALYLHLLQHACFPKWPEVFSLADRVLESMQVADEKLLLHLKEIAVVNPNLDTKKFMVELLHRERTKAEKLTKTQKPGSNKGLGESAALFTDPLIYLRKWIGEGFVGVLDTPAIVWLWDQLFMEKWDRKSLIDTCLALLLLLKHRFLEATDHASMAEVFQTEPCKLYTKDIQRAWMHLQYGGLPDEVPYFNRRRPKSLQSAPATAPLEPVGVKAVMVYLLFSPEILETYRWATGFDPDDVKLLCTVYFGSTRLGSQTSTKPSQCPLGARQLDDGKTGYKIYFPKTVLEFRGLDPSNLDVEEEMGAQPHAVIQVDYYGHEDTKAGRTLPITLGWARLPLYTLQSKDSDGNEAGLKLWVADTGERTLRLFLGSVPDTVGSDPLDAPPRPSVDPVYIEADSTLHGSVFDLRREAPPSRTATQLKMQELEKTMPDNQQAKPPPTVKEEIDDGPKQEENTMEERPIKDGNPPNPKWHELPKRRKDAKRPVIREKRFLREPSNVVERPNRTPTPPPGLDTPTVDHTFDMYIDSVDNIPDSATVCKVTGRLIKTGSLSGIPDILALPVVQLQARSPSFGYRLVINRDKLCADKDMIALLRVYTIDKNSKDPKTLCVIGSCLFGFYDANGYVRIGAHRRILHTGMPDLSKGVDVLNPSGLDHTPRIPACSIKIRLNRSTEKMENPEDGLHYRFDGDGFNESDQRVAESYAADNRVAEADVKRKYEPGEIRDFNIYPWTVNDMVVKLREMESDTSVEAPRIWIRDRLNQKKHLPQNRPAENLPLQLMVEYRMPVGIKVQVTGAHGLPAGRYIHAFIWLATGSTAAYKTPTQEGYGQKARFYTSSHDYNARQAAPVWLDDPTTIHPHPDWYNCLVVQILGLHAVYHPSDDHNLPGTVTNKAGGPVRLDENSVIGWAVVPLMKRSAVWSGHWRVPILKTRPSDNLLSELQSKPVDVVFQQQKWQPDDFLDGASLDVKVWDAHFIPPQHLPHGLKKQDLLMDIVGNAEQCSLVRLETGGKMLYQMVLAALGKKYQKLGTKSFVYVREKDYFTQVMEKTFATIMKEVIQQVDQRQTPPPPQGER